MRLEFTKAMYRPGETVNCRVSDMRTGGAVSWMLYHLDRETLQGETQDTAEGIVFTLPDRDKTGYLLVVRTTDRQGRTAEVCCAGIDCSSSWTAFPRYGYVWDYTETAEPGPVVTMLCKYRLNSLQFYDWQYRHHLPLSPDPDSWTDWSGRKISGSVIRHYIRAAHETGMACMAYNMIYAANKTYLQDGSGVSPKWRLIKENGDDFTCDMDETLGDVGILQYFNPLNPDWQRYIFRREAEALHAFDFDGWHGDTIGELGPMTAADGGPLGYREDGSPVNRVKDCYTPFLNAAKEAISPRFLTFNPVGAQGIEAVNVSRADALYAEFWPWDRDDRGEPYDDYFSIHRAILRCAGQSGGKSLIVAGYINYKNPAPFFNEPAVRLMDSVVYASGGSRIELGNGDGMLSNEYFPDDRHKRMTPALRAAVQRMYDFITAYQNLLRGGLLPLPCGVQIDAVPLSDDGKGGTVWHFSKSDGEMTAIHFINLTGTDSEWRDVNQTKKVPRALKDLKTRVFTEKPVHSLFIASPDTDDLTLRPLEFTAGQDTEGRFISFVMPELIYWNMILMR